MKAVSLSALLKEVNVSLNAQSVYCALEKTGMLEVVEYLSSTGSGELKNYRRLVAGGLAYGKNIQSAYSEKQEVRFYRSTFPQMLKKIVEQLEIEVAALHRVGEEV